MNLSFMLCILCLILSLFQLDSKTFCADSGSCLNCKQNEMNLDYCQVTGRKMKQSCIDRGQKFASYRECLFTAEDEQMRVIFFQVIMALVGGLAFWGVQVRKQSHMSLFDVRKQNSRRRGN